MEAALQGAKNIPTSFSTACRSQGDFATYSFSSEGIEPMALNTLKSCADKFIEDGGWAKLDHMRKSYFIAVKCGSKKFAIKKNILTIKKEQIIELQEMLEMERRYRIRLQVAYEALLSKLHLIAENEPELRHFINAHVMGFSFKRITLASNSSSSNEH
ncbi:hypothetical protein [Pseudomonas fluorescens]|uniref:hypothetical protein n=1 Tax=Pseudomonas fluorescens TaxID=294 RepID=UPI001249A7C4|nr:hypothetical protein [Pseudomonas fluorescens]